MIDLLVDSPRRHDEVCQLPESELEVLSFRQPLNGCSAGKLTIALNFVNLLNMTGKLRSLLGRPEAPNIPLENLEDDPMPSMDAS